MKEKEFNAIPDNDRFNRVLEGVAYFASVLKPSPGYKKKDPVYIVNLGLENDAEVKKAKSFGLTVKDATEDIPLPYVVIKRKLKGRDPEKVKPIVVDECQNPWPSNVLIGNGSKIVVKFATYWWGDDDEGGVGSTLLKVQVTNLVRFIPDDTKDSDLKYNKDGFNITKFLQEEEEGETISDLESLVIDEEEEDDNPPKTPASVGATNPDIFDE